MADMPVFRISKHRMPRLKRLGAFPVIALSSASIFGTDTGKEHHFSVRVVAAHPLETALQFVGVPASYLTA
jgi:hypothetical protein